MNIKWPWSQPEAAASERARGRMVASALAPPPGARCQWKGCDREATTRCSYRDAFGRRCGCWCEEHSVLGDGTAWCRRHATTVKLLRGRSGTIYENKAVARLDDRGPNLVATVAAAIDEQVVKMLERRFATQPGVRIETDAAPRLSSTPAPPETGEGWQMGWGVFTHQGYIFRVGLRAPSQGAPRIQLLLNGRPCFERTPDWIANRGAESGTQAEDREAFRSRLLSVLEAHLFEPGRDLAEGFMDPAEDYFLTTL